MAPWRCNKARSKRGSGPAGVGARFTGRSSGGYPVPMARLLLALGLLASAWPASWSGPASGAPPPAVRFETAPLTIATATGTHRFTVEVAATPEQRARGLMFRRHLAPDAGMLLVYEAEGTVAIWMKNTYLSLDILFIRGDGRIVHIVEGAAPLSTEPMVSPVPVRAVLELPAGTAARLGIRRGDRVGYAAFGAVGGEPR